MIPAHLDRVLLTRFPRSAQVLFQALMESGHIEEADGKSMAIDLSIFLSSSPASLVFFLSSTLRSLRLRTLVPLGSK